MSNQQIKDTCYWCLVCKLSMHSHIKPSHDYLHLKRGEEIINADFEKFLKYLDRSIKAKFKVLINQGVGYCFVLQSYSAEYKEALSAALKNAGFCTFAGTEQVLIISDVEAAVFSVAREQTEDITVVSLKCEQVITASASKKSVEITDTKELNFNLLPDLKSTFVSLLQKRKHESKSNFDIEWERFEKCPQINKLLQPIKDAFDIHIDKINPKGKIIILSDLNSFDDYIRQKASIMSHRISRVHVEKASESIVEAKKYLDESYHTLGKAKSDYAYIQNLESLANDLKSELETKTEVDLTTKSLEALDEAKQKLQDAENHYEETVKSERATWLKHVVAVETRNLMKGASVACRPIVSDTPFYKDGKKTGTKHILSVNDAYTTIIAIDFGTDTTKFIVYNKIDGKWIEILRDSVLSFTFYDETKEQDLFGDEAWEKYLEYSKRSAIRVYKGFKLMLEKINDHQDIDFITLKIASFLRMIYKKAEIDLEDENVCFSFSYPSVWSRRASLVMRQSVIMSGVQVDANNINRVLMIPEAEAVAISCAETIRTKAKEELSVRDGGIYYLVCDLGAGTSDMSFSGGLSLAKALQKEAKRSLFAPKVIFKEEDGDWDVVTGSAIFAMQPDIITERVVVRPCFLDTYSLFGHINVVAYLKEIGNVEYAKSAALCLCGSTSVESNDFFEYQLSLLTEDSNIASLTLYDGDKSAVLGEKKVKRVDDSKLTRMHTYYIPLGNFVFNENRSFKIRFYPSYSIIEVVFEDAIYRLVGFEAIKIGTPKEEQIQYLSEEEEKTKSKERTRRREAHQNRAPAKSSNFLRRLFHH
ncbi:hypothetical protein [Parasitella parasitica]|uniref:Uncharacterized protein n=1 Tax=Parasitella parasitica TaxID=35722 RepID=A0A0B7MQL7_9FUNG|nr:hypothetical protein [Parasitella parasitica]